MTTARLEPVDPRTPEGEQAVAAAEAYMRGERNLPLETIAEALKAHLFELDPFWPRWICR
jgi:hypothetical protein